MCLLLPCCTGFLARLIANLLSIIELTSLLTLIFRSYNKFIIQTVWDADKALAMYATSQVDNTTTGCLLNPPRNGTSQILEEIFESTSSVNFVSIPFRVWITYRHWIRFSTRREQNSITQSPLNIPQNPDNSLVMLTFWFFYQPTHHFNCITDVRSGVTEISQWVSQLLLSTKESQSTEPGWISTNMPNWLSLQNTIQITSNHTQKGAQWNNITKPNNFCAK